MQVFDLIGPVMIGPSSSHTAGACRLGRIARKILADRPVKARIGLCGSFAQTYRGHGTDKAIIAENVHVGANVKLGVGEYAPSTYDQKVYQFDLVTIGENSVIPDGVQVGKNTAIAGETTVGDYPDGLLASGNYIIKAGGAR